MAGAELSIVSALLHRRHRPQAVPGPPQTGLIGCSRRPLGEQALGVADAAGIGLEPDERLAREQVERVARESRP